MSKAKNVQLSLEAGTDWAINFSLPIQNIEQSKFLRPRNVSCHLSQDGTDKTW